MAEEKDKKETGEVEAMKKALADKDRQIAELLKADAPEEAPEPSKADKALIAEACEAYGISQQYVLSANVRDGEAVVVTAGGAKVRFNKGMDKKEIVPLEAVRVDGIIRKKFKAITGGKKK